MILSIAFKIIDAKLVLRILQEPYDAVFRARITEERDSRAHPRVLVVIKTYEKDHNSWKLPSY